MTTKNLSVSKISKVATAGVIAGSLLATSALPAFAGAQKHSYGPSNVKITKKVKVNNRAGIKTGGSNSHASVNNGVTVNVGSSQGNGGRVMVVGRGGNNHKNNNNNNHKNNNNNNGGKKKVVRVKKVVRHVNNNTYVDNSVADNSYTDNSVTDNSIENNVEQTIVNKNTIKTNPYGHDNYSYDSDNGWGTYSDDCGCYTKKSNVKVTNNNYNTNDNYNKQSVDIYN